VLPTLWRYGFESNIILGGQLMTRKFRQITILATVLLLVLAMLVSVSGCTSTKTTATTSPNAATAPGGAAATTTVTKAAAVTQAKDLIYESVFPPSAPNIGAKEFGDALTNITGGLITTTYNTSGVMGPPTGTYKNIVSNVANWGLFSCAYTPNVFPMTDVLNLPVSVPNPLAITQAAYEMYKKGYFDQEYSQVKPLYLYGINPYELYTSKTITKLSDFSGMKMRCPSDCFVNLTKALGGVPVSLPSAEIYDSLQKGIVDGCWGNGDMAATFKLNEVVKYVYMLNLGGDIHLVAMNKSVFAALPDNAQKFINGLGPQFFLSAAEIWVTSIAKGYATAQQKGLQVINPSSDMTQQINTAIQPLFTNWANTQEAAGRPGKKALQDFYYSLNTEMNIANPFPKPQ
jgi:TRAP-type C4-dicarboxylate transport system substrate-binding protein